MNPLAEQDSASHPFRLQRLGVVMEPEAQFELRPGGGGCEDPRITFIEPLPLLRH